MATVYLQDSTLTSIGNAIREKTGETGLILPKDMAGKISGIQSGGGADLSTVYQPGVREYTNTAHKGYYDISSWTIRGVELNGYANIIDDLKSDKFRFCRLLCGGCNVFITKEMMNMTRPSWFPTDGTTFRRFNKDSTTAYEDFTGKYYIPAWISRLNNPAFTEFPWRDGKKNMCLAYYLQSGTAYIVVVEITDDYGNKLAMPQTNPKYYGAYETIVIKEA